jgi:Predicted transcriptional regulators
MRKFMFERRRKLGFSQQIAAEKAGMTRSNYAHIERGRHEPSIEQMEAIANALNVKKPSVNFFKDFCDDSYQKSNSDQAATTEPGPAA